MSADLRAMGGEIADWSRRCALRFEDFSLRIVTLTLIATLLRRDKQRNVENLPHF